MESTDKLLAIFWCLVAIVAIIIVTCVTAHNINQTEALERMVKNGADPMRAGCALDRQVYCSAIAAH